MIHDLPAFDRLVSRAALAVQDGEAALLDGVYRETAKQSVHRELLAIDPGLAAHVARLTVARVTRGAWSELARGMETQAFGEGLPRTTTGTMTLDGAILEALGAPSSDVSRAWLEVAGRASICAADAARAVEELEKEAAQRLGIESQDEGAGAFLDATADLARSIASDPAAVLAAANARSASEGWPRKPSVQFAVEVFGAEARRSILRIADRVRVRRPPPIVLGASSHARALRDVVFEWHARMPGDAPFARRHDPDWTEAHVSGLLVASALVTPAFHKRLLGTGERVAKSQARALAIAALFTARIEAARLVPPTAERSERVFGRPLEGRLDTILPRPRRDARGRFAAWRALPEVLRQAMSNHDEDWFRNPRFWDEMAIRFASPRAPSAEAPGLTALLEGWLA